MNLSGLLSGWASWFPQGSAPLPPAGKADASANRAGTWTTARAVVDALVISWCGYALWPGTYMCLPCSVAGHGYSCWFCGTPITALKPVQTLPGVVSGYRPEQRAQGEATLIEWDRWPGPITPADMEGLVDRDKWVTLTDPPDVEPEPVIDYTAFGAWYGGYAAAG